MVPDIRRDTEPCFEISFEIHLRSGVGNGVRTGFEPEPHSRRPAFGKNSPVFAGSSRRQRPAFPATLAAAVAATLGEATRIAPACLRAHKDLKLSDQIWMTLARAESAPTLACEYGNAWVERLLARLILDERVW
jgi:hypothetical protein